MAGAGGGVATGAGARFGTKSTVSTASVGAIGIPVAPPFDSGAIPRACH
jgi:hypothetical protein